MKILPRTFGPEHAIALTISCAFLMQQIDTTLLTLAIPTMGRELQVAPLALHLAVTAYLLSLALFMPISGWCADRFGARRVFAAAIGIFVLGSALSGLAPNLEILVLARLIQGMGGAMMTPVGRLIVLRAFGPGRTLDATVWLTLPQMIGPLIGPLIGAMILSVASWRWIFYVNLPICAVMLVFVFRLIKPMPGMPQSPFDWRGFAIAGTALTLFQLMVENLAHPVLPAIGTLALGLGSGGAAWAYWRHARRTADPALSLRAFREPAFQVGVIAGGIGRIGLNSLSFLLPLFLQIAMGYSAVLAGILVSTAAFGAMISKTILRPAIRMLDYARTLATILVLAVLALAGFALLGNGVPVIVLVGYVLFAGGVRTIFFNAVNSLTYLRLQDADLSRSVATAGVFQQLSMGLGVSVAAVVLNIVSGNGADLGAGTFHLTFAIMALLPLAALPWLVKLRRVERMEVPAQST